MIPKLISLYLVTPDWEGRLAIPAKKKATSAKYELRLSLAKRSVWVGAGADSKERSRKKNLAHFAKIKGKGVASQGSSRTSVAVCGETDESHTREKRGLGTDLDSLV